MSVAFKAGVIYERLSDGRFAEVTDPAVARRAAAERRYSQRTDPDPIDVEIPKKCAHCGSHAHYDNLGQCFGCGARRVDS